MRLANRTALITGGGSGIGLATAERFVAEGARVAIFDRDAASVTAAVSHLGPSAIGFVGDVGDGVALAAAARSTRERLHGLHVVFASAGISEVTTLDAPGEAFQRILDINLVGAFRTVQASLPHLDRGASIVLIGSVQSTLGTAGAYAYAVSKAGIRTLTRSLAAELAPRGIRVNAVVPGAVRTPIWANRAPTEAAMAQLEERGSRGIALGRFADPAEIASGILFLASEEASYITATELVMDGGFTGAAGGAPAFRHTERA